jgi:AcrR family transcriptional regulator
VGIGTLYRHYPTRESLVEAAYRNEVERLCAAAPALLEKHPPAEALGKWMARFIDYMATKRGMSDALRAVIAAGGNPFNQSRALLTQSIALLVDAGKANGSLRADLAVDDVLSMSPLLQNENVAQAKRIAGILLDGMRVPARSKRR